MKNIIFLILCLTGSCGPSADVNVIFQEFFDYPDGELPSHWWSEGSPAVIRDGRLYTDALNGPYRVSTIWLDLSLSCDLLIEFDAHVVDSENNANNINCFFHYSDPSGPSLRETTSQRENGAYNHYHQLNGYIFTYLANGNPDTARFRFRDNPGFNLLQEVNQYDCKVGKTYCFKIEKTGNRFRFWVDGMQIMDMADDIFNPLHDQGLFGFRTFNTILWWDNLTISRL
jgi:hypothetical protein